MIFSVQRFLEDYLRNRNLTDGDQYAIKLANLYARYRNENSGKGFLVRLHHVQTTFYRNNTGVNRHSLECQVLAALDQKFAKTKNVLADLFAEPSARSERLRLRMPRRSIDTILKSFQRATQGRAIDTFWISRKAEKLRARPETIAQGLLSQFVLGVFSNGRGQLLREVNSGVGFVDVIVMLGTVHHLVEIKVQQNQFTGVAQLNSYMMNENRSTGWLVIFDARSQASKAPIPNLIKATSGTIKVIVIDINPIPPSRKK